MLFATVGKTTYPASTVQQVSAAYTATINRLGLGASEAPPCRIVDERGKIVFHVSYNGKVWKGAEWKPGDKPVYVPN